jgi:hypothetical protein
MFPDAKIFIAYVTEDGHAFVNEFHAATYRNELELLPGAAWLASLRLLQDPRELFELVAEIALADALTGGQKDEYPNIFNKNHNDFFPSEQLELFEMYKHRTLTNEEKELLCSVEDGDFPINCGNGLFIFDNVHIENERWNELRLAVFQFEGDDRLFGLYYGNPLTENQEGWYPNSRDGNHDEFVPFEVTVTTKVVREYKKKVRLDE